MAYPRFVSMISPPFQALPQVLHNRGKRAGKKKGEKKKGKHWLLHPHKEARKGTGEC